MMDYSKICPYCHATPEEGCRCNCNQRPSVHQMAQRFAELYINRTWSRSEIVDEAYNMARAMWERGEKEEGE